MAWSRIRPSSFHPRKPRDSEPPLRFSKQPVNPLRMENTSDPLLKTAEAPVVQTAPRRKAWKPILKFTAAAGILSYLLYKVPFSDIWAAMMGAKWKLLLGAVVMTFLVQWTTADRLRRLLAVSGNRISTWQIFEINLSTLFYGLFLPGGNFTGIAIRFYRLSAEKQNAYATGVALFSDRVISTVTLLFVGILFWLPYRQDEGWIPLWIMSGALVGLVGAIAAFLCADQFRFMRPLQRLLTRFGGKIGGKIRSALHDQSKCSTAELFRISLLSIVTHLFGIVAYTLIAQSLGIEIGWVAMGWVRSSIILATMIPLTPSGIGLREGASLLLLTQMGVSEETALAFSLLVFGMTVLLVGAVGSIFEGRRLAKF
jgi:glycosyltransferase 2 family protein